MQNLCFSLEQNIYHKEAKRELGTVVYTYNSGYPDMLYQYLHHTTRSYTPLGTWKDKRSHV
jgi:hypothetical protein